MQTTYFGVTDGYYVIHLVWLAQQALHEHSQVVLVLDSFGVNPLWCG